MLLWLSGAAPLGLARFLDDSVERGLLSRVGGGYAFAHPALMAHWTADDGGAG